jgi:hypothetical protein
VNSGSQSIGPRAPHLPRLEALSAEAWQESSITYSISDVTTTAFRKAIGGGTDAMRSVRKVQASDSLADEQILEVVGRNGWVTAAPPELHHRHSIRNAPRGADDGRPRPEPPPFASDDPTGVHRFVRG